MDILFFWQQPRYRSDLDTLLSGLIKENPALSAQKEAGMKRLWNRSPFDTEETGSLCHAGNPLPASKTGK
ncbi:MAG: DUF3460 family protein [Alistipes senegalensis]|nr:DUF3460 family protein [Oxalobacter formigenes]MCM1281342.1 DUF3460 family protein [Alistipes senegalensis]